MYLVTAATEYEMKPFLSTCGSRDFMSLVSGIGPLETAVRLSSWLHSREEIPAGVINFGVAGAYPQSGGIGPGLLDICLAKQEIMGDLGICLHDRIEPFSGRDIAVPCSFVMNPGLLDSARAFLQGERLSFYCGTFITVNCASGTAARGKMLAGRYKGICENMEGAAVARVCAQFNLPCLEIRCISNMVEDRDTGRWQLQKACRRAAQVTASILRHLADGNR